MINIGVTKSLYYVEFLAIFPATFRSTSIYFWRPLDPRPSIGVARERLSNLAFISIDMAAGQRKPDARKSGRQTLNREMFRYNSSISLLLTSEQESALKVSITNHRPQTPIGKSARLEAMQHLEKRADFQGQTIQQHPFPSLSTSNTHSSVNPLFVLMLPLETNRKKSVYRTYQLARSLQA